MRLKLPTVAFALIAVNLLSCSHKEENNANRTQVDALYADLVETYKSYTDSLSKIKNQTSADSISENPGEALINRFEQRLINVYRKYPADMDMNLTEAQNDTIWQLTRLYILQRDRFLHHTMPADTITSAADSTEVAQ